MISIIINSVHLFDVHKPSRLLFLLNVFITKAFWIETVEKVKLSGNSKFGRVLMKFLVRRTSASGAL